MSRHVWKPISWDAPAGGGTTTRQGGGQRLAGRHSRDAGGSPRALVGEPAGDGAALRPGGALAVLPPAAPAAVVAPEQAVTLPLAPPEPQPRQRLSWPRVLVALLVVAGVALGGVYGVRTAVANRAAAGLAPTWFAPYVDVTLTPTYQFQDPAAEPARQVVLGFVVADPHAGCTPSWGGYYGLDAAAQALSLDGRLAQLRSEGIGAVVSFGGKSGTDLAQSCKSASRLAAAYLSVTERYHATTVDFDVEGAALTDFAALRRRAAALRDLQARAAAQHRRLAIWLTLPVERSGLTAPGLSVLEHTLADHVRLAGVDVMAMDYGPPVGDMGVAAEQALAATEAQLVRLYPRYGIRLPSAVVWHTLGVTVMIGQNDDAGEVFTTADAATLERFAHDQHLGRVSMWSLNRDRQCGSDYGVTGVLSNSCSGASQTALQFDSTFAQLSGSALALAGRPTPLVAGGAAVSPADAPYPLWQPADPYVTGYKVVRFGDIYQAKWYNQGQDPAADVQYAWQTPWTLIGPVLPGDRAPVTTTLPLGTYPAWSPSASYQAGSRVLFAGMPYRAKWFNQGDSPAAEPANPTGSPWEPLFSVPGEPTGASG